MKQFRCRWRRCLLFILLAVGCASIQAQTVTVLQEAAPVLEVQAHEVSNREAIKEPFETQLEAPSKTVTVTVAKETEQVNKTDDVLIEYLARRYKQNIEHITNVVELAGKYADAVFPTREMILAVIAIESSFNPKAKHLGSFGLMQINAAAHKKALTGKNVLDTETNISLGVQVLRQYFDLAGQVPRNAILAYNAGIGAFFQRRYNPKYLEKYEGVLAQISK